MPTASAHLAVCASQIGHYGDYNKYNSWYWGSDVGYAWCAAYQSWCASQSGLPAAYSASAAGYATQFDRVDDGDVRPGDIVIFNWDGRTDTGWADHVGIVEWSTISANGYFGTIEGNTGNGDVARVTRYNWGSYFTAFYRPAYDAESKPASNPKEGDKVQPVYNPSAVFYKFYRDCSKSKLKAARHRYARTKSGKAKLEARGYRNEGPAWRVGGGTLAVYKMYNPSSGDMILTVKLADAKELQAQGWEYKGVPFFASKKGTPVYRMYHSGFGQHYFTTDKSEYKGLRKGGWKPEGVAFYVLSAK